MSDSESDGGDSLPDADIRLFETGDIADATIVCGGRTWNVHKIILGSRCKWFKTAFYNENFTEAMSSKVELNDENPDLIDVLLRFIYAKDIDIPKLKDGENVPALCVQIFRLADFFLLEKLKQKAMAQLRFQIAVMPLILDTETSNGKCPQWLSEILDALEEAYKDRSTEPTLTPLLYFVYMKRHKIFRNKDACALLDRIPQMASDLMRNYIIHDLVTQDPSRRFCSGLPIHAAVHFPDHVYEPSNDDLDPEVTIAPCRLQPETGGNSPSRPFRTTDPDTGEKLAKLGWIAPCSTRILEMGSSRYSTIVSAVIQISPGCNKMLYVRFDDREDASLFVNRYCQANEDIKDVVMDGASLAQEMSKAIAAMSWPSTN